MSFFAATAQLLNHQMGLNKVLFILIKISINIIIDIKHIR